MIKINSNLYSKAKQEAQYITEVVTSLETLANLVDQDLLKDGMSEKYEYRQLRDIKNALSNIYLLLDLNKVEGVADQIFNSEFVKK